MSRPPTRALTGAAEAGRGTKRTARLTRTTTTTVGYRIGLITRGLLEKRAGDYIARKRSAQLAVELSRRPAASAPVVSRRLKRDLRAPASARASVSGWLSPRITSRARS